MSPLLAVRGLEKTSSEFRQELCNVAHRLGGLDPSFLAACICVETGGTFSPSVKNPFTGAVGLIQFMPKTAEALGTAADELSRMTDVEQLAYVERYFERCGALSRIRLHIPGDYYLAIFMPSAVGKPADHVLFYDYQKGYAQNRGLDKDGNGTITVSDCTRTVDNVVAEAVKRGVLGVAA